MAVYSGYLTVKIPGSLKKTTFSNSWCMLYSTKGNLPAFLRCHEDPNNLDSKPVKQIEMGDVKWQSQDVDTGFCIHDNKKKKSYFFVAPSGEEKAAWIHVLCCVSPNLFYSYKSSPGDTGLEVMQDNCLYASNRDVSLFNVVAGVNGSCSRFGFNGLMKLSFEPQYIKLYKFNGEHPVAQWTYYSIRNFGHSRHTLSITTGTSSSTGKGEFHFMTIEGSEMAGLMNEYTRRLKGQESSDRTALSTGIAGAHNLTSPLSPTSSNKTKPAPGIPSPKPISPLPDQSPGPLSPNTFDAQFKKELNLTIAQAAAHGDVKQPLEKKTSNGSHKFSNDSIGKKEGKKALSDKEKKKEEKRLAKAEKEKLKQLEKMKKNSKDKNNIPPTPRKSYVQEQEENQYSEAYDSENLYAECENVTRSEPPTRLNVESKVYNEPWGALPQFPIAQNNPPVNSNDYSDVGDLYSSPVKLGHKQHNTTGQLLEEENYEDMGPPDIPIKSDSLAEDDNSDTNIYNHFDEANPSPTHQQQPENVYGLESGKVLNNNVRKNPSKPDANIYESVE